MAQHLLRDEELRQFHARSAYRFLRDELPVLAVGAGNRRGRRGDRRAPPRTARGAVAADPAARGRPRAEPAERAQPPQFPGDTERPGRRRAASRAEGDAPGGPRAAARDRSNGASLAAHALPMVDGRLASSRAYDAFPRPLISVVTPLYNYAHHIGAALGSVVATAATTSSSSSSTTARPTTRSPPARRFIAEHEGVSMMLARHPVNRGPRARAQLGGRPRPRPRTR